MSTPASLNEVNLAAVTSLVSHIAAQPEAARSKWSAEVEWQGAFRSQARVRDFAPIPSDEPVALGGSDRAPNPVEQLLGALGNCLAVGYAANASAAGIAIRALRISLEGSIDLRTFLGLAQGNAGYEGISVRVALDTDATEEQTQALHRKVIGTSPVGHTLERAVPINVELVTSRGRN
jgi:uncharacterized OsmC-like protein